MTKAAIVNEIFLKMGTDRKEVLQIVVGLMESVKKYWLTVRMCT